MEGQRSFKLWTETANSWGQSLGGDVDEGGLVKECRFPFTKTKLGALNKQV